MGKILKKISLWFLGILLFFVVLIAGTLTWVYHHPKETWSLVEEKFLPEDLKITWDEMQFQGRHLSGFDFEFDIGFQGLSIQKTKPLVDVVLENFRLHSSVLMSSEKQKVIVHQAQVLAKEALVYKPEPSKEPSQPQNPFQTAQQSIEMIHTFQKWVQIENLDIQVPAFHFGEAPMAIAIDAKQVQQNQISDLLKFKASIRQSGESPFVISSAGDLRLSLLNSEESFVQGNLDVNGFGVRTDQNVTISYFKDSISLKTEGRVDYQKAGPSKLHLIAEPKLHLRMNEKEAELDLQSNFNGLPGPVVKIDNFKAHLRTPFDKNIFWSERASQFEVSAPVGVFFVDQDMRRPLEKSCQCKIPEVLLTEVKGQAWISNLLAESEEKKPALDVQFSIESIENKLMTVNFKGDLKADKQSKEWIYQPTIDATAQVHSFQGLRQFLDAKGILIPAPLDVLDGTISLKAQGPVETTRESFTLPILVSADLASATQKVKIDSTTSMRLRSDFTEAFADVKVRIADFQVELPPLDPLEGKPRVTLDQRILRKPAVARKSKSKFKMSFAIEVETVQPGAIRLASEFFKPVLPLTMKIQHGLDQTNSGFVQTEPFNIVYLRRTVHVEKMRIDLSQSKDGAIPVDGRFRIKQADYQIYIDVKGNIAKPNIRMSSDPDLTQSEIISVLLYGRTSKDLIAAEAETAGSVQAAVADRAIGLFGLWAFASTPIQSFSYNPVTKVYTATVSLGDDLSAGIGTNWEAATNLELRKRISKQWVLTAEWVPATQDEEQTTRLVLQWERRF